MKPHLQQGLIFKERWGIGCWSSGSDPRSRLGPWTPRGTAAGRQQQAGSGLPGPLGDTGKGRGDVVSAVLWDEGRDSVSHDSFVCSSGSVFVITVRESLGGTKGMMSGSLCVIGRTLRVKLLWVIVRRLILAWDWIDSRLVGYDLSWQKAYRKFSEHTLCWTIAIFCNQSLFCNVQMLMVSAESNVGPIPWGNARPASFNIWKYFCWE